MTFGRIGTSIEEDFSVTNSSDVLVSGIDGTSFSSHLFNSNGDEVSSTVLVSITELGHGHYRAQFIPNNIGTWFIAVYHPIYFPWGKIGTIQVFSNDFDTISTVLTRALGLSQENFYMDNNVYDTSGNLISGRIRIYSDSISVGSNSNILSTYEIAASYTNGQMDNYSVKKQ